MTLLSLFRRRRVDVGALNYDIRLVSRKLRAIETHLARAKDADGLKMASELHTLLQQGLLLHGPVLGVDLAPFSGGVKPD